MTNSKMKPDSLKFLSLNVRGLGNFRKRRAIFTWCRKQNADLIFLQETHSTKSCESQLFKPPLAAVPLDLFPTGK